MAACSIGGSFVMYTAEAQPGVRDRVLGGRRATLWVGAGQVVVAWLFGRLVVTAHSSVAPLSFRAQDWYHWDAFNYLAIATSGRTLGVCGTSGFPAFVKGAHWCGLAGWLPGFPLTMKAVGVTGISLVDVSVVLPSLFLAAALFVVWFGWLRDCSPWRSMAVLLLVAVFPGAVYNVAPYPTSLALLGILIAASAATRAVGGSSWWWGSPWPSCPTRPRSSRHSGSSSGSSSTRGAVASGRRSRTPPGPRPGSARWPPWPCTISSSSTTGAPTRWYRTGRTRVSPFPVSRRSTSSSGAPPGPRSSSATPVRGSCRSRPRLAIVLVVTACIVGLRHWWRRGRSRLDLYPATIGAVALAFMLSSGTGSIWHRGVMLAAPSVLAFRHLPPWVTGLLVAATAVVTALVSSYFFANTLG